MNCKTGLLKLISDDEGR